MDMIALNITMIEIEVTAIIVKWNETRNRIISLAQLKNRVM